MTNIRTIQSVTALNNAFVGRWQASHAYLANDLMLAPDGTIIQRNTNGTSRATYDVTEQALWTVKTGSGGGGGLSVVAYSGSLGASRPAVTLVVWEGFPSQPTNFVAGDLWMNPDVGGTLLTGTGAPASGTGQNGDVYLDTAAAMLYGPKASGSWPAGVSLVGPAGSGGGGGSVATDTLFDAKGDLAVGTADNTAARLARGGDGYALVADSTQTTGLTWAPRSRVVDEVHSDVTIVNTTTETTAATLTLPTTLAAGDLVRFSLWGEWLNNSGASVTYMFKLKCGTTTIMSTGTNSIVANSNQGGADLTAEAIVVSTTSQRWRSRLFMQRGLGSLGTTWYGGTGGPISYQGYGTSAEDTTSAKTVALTVQMGTAAALANFVSHGATLEIIKKA